MKGGCTLKRLRSEEEVVYVIETYSNTIFKVALTHTQNRATAEDIVQSTFMKFMECEIDFESEEHIKAWLLKVSINESKMFHRLFWNRMRIPLEDVYSFELEEQHDVFYEVMKLPSKFRLVIHLYYYEGYSIKDISGILYQKENTIASWLHRARKRLKEDLEANYEN